MKSTLNNILIVSLLSSRLSAQKPPLSAPVTNTHSTTIKFDPNQQIPQLPCLLTTGQIRPFACEFYFDKLAFYSNDGSLLGTVKASMGQQKSTMLPFNKAKKSPPAGKGGMITYSVKAYCIRRNKPAFPVSTGYRIRACQVTNCLPSDILPTILLDLKIPEELATKAVFPFDLSWQYSKKDSNMIGPRKLYIENDVTTTKFPTNPMATSQKPGLLLRLLLQTTPRQRINNDNPNQRNLPDSVRSLPPAIEYDRLVA